MSLFFKFKSAKDFDRLECDNPNMSAFDVKMAIVSKHKLERDPNFDLQLVNAQVRARERQERKKKGKETNAVWQSQEEYGESSMVPSGTSLIVKRVPVKQQRRKFDNSTGGATSMGPPMGLPAASLGGRGPEMALPLLAGGGESERIEALIAQGPGWAAGQVAPNRPRFLQTATQKTPPPTYVCHRCQMTGHWINMCPTNGDPKYDFKRIKKVRLASLCHGLSCATVGEPIARQYKRNRRKQIEV